MPIKPRPPLAIVQGVEAFTAEFEALVRKYRGVINELVVSKDAIEGDPAITERMTAVQEKLEGLFKEIANGPEEEPAKDEAKAETAA